MKTSLFKKQSQINTPVKEVFKWHARPGAIERLSPPCDPLEIIHSSGGIHIGAQVTMRMKAGPIPYKWHARHIEYEKNSLFKNMQVRGPFSKWIHTHRFEPIKNDRCLLEDTIEYALPFHPISTAILGGFVQKKLNRIFTYRHNTTIDDIACHQSTKQHGQSTFLISGARGLIGSTLIPFLTTGGHNILKLARRPADKDIGIVLSPRGGALGKLLLPFQLGMGGKISSGRQFMRWISIDDAVGAIHHTIFNDQITGPVNLVSPYPSTNKEFTQILSKVLLRPSFFTMPKKAIEIAFGKEMGRETILSSTRVKPAVLEKVGYRFRHPELASALAHLLGKNNGDFS
ncbi:MAG: DUF1731 domain-containing protein [Dissulfuribacterales bacterium]